MLLRACLALFFVLVASQTALTAQSRDSVRLNRTIELLDQGEAVFGIISGDRSLHNARSLARSGLDFIVVDMEHGGSWDAEILQTFLLGMTDKRAIVDNGNLQMAVTPMVRIPTNGREMNSFVVKQALDMGAFGILFPWIENREEALNAVRSMRYAQPVSSMYKDPPGYRGRSPSIASWYWGLSSSEYYGRADLWPTNPRGNLLAMLEIESPLGLENLEDIVTTPGVGVIFVGPNDVATGMGYGDTVSPLVEEAIQRVLASCLRNNVPCGITTSAETVQQRIREGFKVVTVGGDGGITPGTARTLDLGLTEAGRR